MEDSPNIMSRSGPAKPNQIKKFLERRSAEKRTVIVSGEEFVAFQNVYDTSTDTELMADSISILPTQTFIEIGCGTGAVSLLVAKMAKSGVGVDINKDAVKNAQLNMERLGIENVEFKESNVFDDVKRSFDVVICNPPYNSYKPKDEVEMMFWDENNYMKLKFFSQVKDRLNPEGKVYFGWADFADIDQDFPLDQANIEGLVFIKRNERLRDDGRKFYVYEFTFPR